MFDKLSAAGLTVTESKLYVTLLDLGKSQAGMLSRKTGIHRRSVYDALERLIEKGLVSYIKENDKRYYLAENPSRLSEIMELQSESISSALPGLLARFGQHKEKQDTRFYRGVDGLRTVFEDQIEEAKPVYIIGASYDASKIMKYYMPHYTSRRVKKKLKLYLIYCGKEREFRVPYGETAYLPERYAGPVSTNIYADKVAIIVWSDEPVALLIKNRKIAQSYKSYFDLLWEHAKKK